MSMPSHGTTMSTVGHDRATTGENWPSTSLSENALNRSIYFERPVVRPDYGHQSEIYKEAMKQDC